MNGIGDALMGMIHVSMNRLPEARRVLSGITMLALVGIVLLLVAGSASAGEQGGIGCVNSTGWAYQCGDTVAESCTFNGDLSCESPRHGLIVGTDGITIDGAGYTITGNRSDCPACTDTRPQDTYCGILNTQGGDVVIKNLEVRNFCTGITTARDDNLICNCSVHDNGVDALYTHGIALSNSQHTTIDNCSVYNNTGNPVAYPVPGGNGIFLIYSSNYCNIINNTVTNNSVYGIYLYSASKHCYIFNNSVEENGGSYGGYGGCGGIVLDWPGGISNYATIENNTASNNTGPGIHVYNSYNTIRDNVVTGNKNTTSPYLLGYGIYIERQVDYADHNTVNNNTVCANEGTDIYNRGGSDNTGDDNTCDTTYRYNDTGTTGCTYNCPPGIGCINSIGYAYQCGDTVTDSCVFNGDMICTNTAKCGLVIGANNIIIDGAGYKLKGNVANADCSEAYEGYPDVTHSGIINTGGYDGVVIKDVEIQNFCTGVVMARPLIENMTVTGCKIHDCGKSATPNYNKTHGIHLVNPIYSTITKNEIYNISGGSLDDCGGGGNGIFMYGGQSGSWEHGSGDHNTITCNRIYNVDKTGIFMKMGCMHNYVSHNYITGCPESAINPMCMCSNYNTYEYNNLSNNIGSGYSTGGEHNVLRFNTANNNPWGGIGAGYGGNIVTNNTACGNGYRDINGAICGNNTCNISSGTCCNWTCNNLTSVYFDFDGDGHYSNTTENCMCNNKLGVGACCNPGLFNGSEEARNSLEASCDCSWEPGDDPNDCDPSIPEPKPDLVITEKLEEWVDLVNKTYNVTYTVKNIGNADANESTTAIIIDGTEVATDPVETLSPQATHTAELGPFTMSDGSDTIHVCADNESNVTESNEDNNCLQDTFEHPGIPDLVITRKYEEWVAGNDTWHNYTITYTVKNTGAGDAGASTTSIIIDEAEVATDPVGALDEGESYTSTLGPFTMSGVSDTIIICADNESMVDESDEDNNCIENTFNYSEIGCVAVDGTLFRYGNTVTKSCTLNGDMTCTSGAGLTIGADGITIDGNDHSMTGTVTPDDCNGMGSEASPCTVSGIYNAVFDNVMIKNLEIENFCTGIALTGVCNITINNCSIHDNGFNTGNMATHGIHACNIAEGTPDDPALTITENEIYNNEGTGAACGDGGNGIFIFAGSGDKHEYCNISHNRLHNNAKAGFWTKMMLTRSEIAHNEIWGNGYGTGVTDGQRGGIVLRCKMSNENLIAHNDVHNNDVDGIFIGGSSNTIEYNNVTNNTDDGIDMGRSDGSYDNELYENTVCENWDSDISTFGAGSNTIGDDNTCDTTKDYDDNGTTGCTYSCGSAGICGDVDGLPGVTTNDGRQIFMYLLHGAEEYPLADTVAADCDGLCDGITTNDGRQIFMYLLHGAEEYPLNCSC